MVGWLVDERGTFLFWMGELMEVWFERDGDTLLAMMDVAGGVLPGDACVCASMCAYVCLCVPVCLCVHVCVL